MNLPPPQYTDAMELARGPRPVVVSEPPFPFEWPNDLVDMLGGDHFVFVAAQENPAAS